jgi:hypothetical protein
MIVRPANGGDVGLAATAFDRIDYGGGNLFVVASLAATTLELANGKMSQLGGARRVARGVGRAVRILPWCAARCRLTRDMSRGLVIGLPPQRPKLVVGQWRRAARQAAAQFVDQPKDWLTLERAAEFFVKIRRARA